MADLHMVAGLLKDLLACFLRHCAFIKLSGHYFLVALLYLLQVSNHSLFIFVVIWFQGSFEKFNINFAVFGEHRFLQVGLG